MLRQHRSIIIGAVACAVACVVLCSSAVGALRSLELYHDDSTAEGEFTAQVGQVLAAGFQAPEGTQYLLGARIYIMDDGLANPNGPGLPTTMPFTVWAWESVDGTPGAPANDGYLPFTDFAECPEDVWVEITLPEPIDITDPVSFPDRRFFIGLEWEHRNNPVLGLDLDPPFSSQTVHWDWISWSVVDTADVLIRAVVSDTSAVPVEVRSWSGVKSEYR